MLSTCRTKLDYCKIKINENKHNSDVQSNQNQKVLFKVGAFYNNTT